MAGRPYSPCKREGRDGETTWLPSGLSLPPYLEIRRSKDISFYDVIPMPSFREKRIAVEFRVVNPLRVKSQLTATCRIADTRSDKVVEMPAHPFTLSGEDRETKVVAFEWRDPVLWFPDDPHLLDLSLSIHDGERQIDETFPVRFGFREVWAEGGDFWFNGVRLCMQGQCHSFPGHDRKKAEETICRLGLIGFRASIGYFLGRDSMPQAATEATLKAADAAGFLFNFKLYGGGLTAEGDRRARRDYFRQFRPHPCVVAYTQCQYGYHGPAHGSPISLGRPVDEKEKALTEYQSDQALVDLCHEQAPGSLVSYYQEGVVGDYRSYMQYLGYGTPVQTREEWPRYWAQQRPAAFFGAELDMSCDLYIWKWQKGFRAGGTPFAQGTEPLVTEHAARYFGDVAYANETPETVKAIQSHGEKETEYDLSQSPNAVSLKAMLVERTTRAWRTYGISYLIHDDSRITYRPDLTLSASDLAYQKNNARFLAYVGGLESDFARKDHAFHAGEAVQKTAVLINNKFHPVEASVRWRLVRRGAAEVLLTTSEKLRVQAGEILKHPVEFSAPPVTDKTLYTIELQVQQEGERSEDVFHIEVFPKPTLPDLGKAEVAVADETGDTSAVLRKAGVTSDRAVRLSGGNAAAEQALAGADILVIGRKSLPSEVPTIRMLFRAAENGLNIVCFEQIGKELFGLRNDDPNTRHAFISARDHPVVHGLSDEDFRDWRGASDILEPYPDYRQGTQYGLLTHKTARGFFGQCEFAQWSSNGTVATFHIDKPQTGTFRTIVSSGFDMLYSPLVELRAGQGTVLLCQLDVTNRYGTDPVATLVVNRLLQYAAGNKAHQPGTVAWWGSPYWGKVLAELHVARTELASLKGLAGTKVALIGIDSCLLRQVAKKERPDEKAAKAAAAPEVDMLKKEGDAGEEDEEEFPKEKQDDQASAAAASVSGEARDRLKQLEADKDAVSTFLNGGGILIVPYVPSHDYVKWLPFTMKIEGKDFYRGHPQGVDVLSGLSASDFFFREVFRVPAIAELPLDGAALQDCGLVGTARCGKGMVVFCQLYPELFPAAWQRTKVLRLLATILTNLGVGLEEPEAGADGRNLADLFYATPALDFNPDLHTSW
jgi:beta-galactosidase